MKTRTLFVNPKPFTFSQNFIMFEEGKEITNTEVPMNILEESIVAYAHLHNVAEINIAGPKIYTKGIQRKIQKIELEKYSENTLKINLV